MGIFETLIFYGMIGAGVSIALLAKETTAPTARRVFLAATAILFWPIYVPVLLSNGQDEMRPLRPETGYDDFSRAVQQVEKELDRTFANVDEQTRKTIDFNCERLEDLKLDWQSQIERIRELDAVLSEINGCDKMALATDESAASAHESERARQANVAQLRDLRQLTYQNLMTSLASTREFISLVHLSRFTGKPVASLENPFGQLLAVDRCGSSEHERNLRVAE